MSTTTTVNEPSALAASAVDSAAAAGITEDKEETSEERIAWLRKRGVVIEMPGEKGKPVVQPSSDPNNAVPVTCVRIPWDDSQPYEEITVTTYKDRDGDQFLHQLKPYFSTSGSKLDDRLLQEAAAKQFGNQELPSISKSTVEKFAGEGSVESFPLSQPYRDSHSNGVSIYLDEAGQLKGLHSNRRATELARLCGFDGVPFVGDVFVGRVHLDQTKGLQNTSFHQHEVASGADWLKGVVNSNYQHGIETNKVGMQESNAPTERTNKAGNCTWKEISADDSIEVMYSLPEDVTHKDIVVKFSSKEVLIKHKSNLTSVLLQLKLVKEITPDECTWTVASHSKRVIDLSLCKASSSPWGEQLEV